MGHQSTGNMASVTSYSPEPKEKADTNPSDQQPPGVDEQPYEALEEALLGE